MTRRRTRAPLPFVRPFERPASSQRGAEMGRPSDPAEAFHGAGGVQGTRVPLDAGGYDPGGAYWGKRRPGFRLFCFWTLGTATHPAVSMFRDIPDGAHAIETASALNAGRPLPSY